MLVRSADPATLTVMRKTLAVGISVAAVVLISAVYLLWFWPAEGEVAISIDRSSLGANPVLSSSTLTVVSGPQEYVIEVQPSAGLPPTETLTTPIAWSLRSPLIVKFQPSFRDDLPVELVITPQDAGFWAGSAGKVVFINLEITDTEVSLGIAAEAAAAAAANSVSAVRANETTFRQSQDTARASCEASGLEETFAALVEESKDYFDFFDGYEDLKDLGLRQGDAITVSLRLADMAIAISAYVEDFNRNHDSSSLPSQVTAGQEIMLDIATKREQQGFAILDYKIDLYQSLNGQIIADGTRLQALSDELLASLEAEAPVRLSEDCAIAYPY